MSPTCETQTESPALSYTAVVSVWVVNQKMGILLPSQINTFKALRVSVYRSFQASPEILRKSLSDDDVAS